MPSAARKSREDYLEAILILTMRNGACRLTDIADFLHYSKPSVSVALRKLEDEKLVERDDWRVVLTPEGKSTAYATLEKHTFFRELFESIGISPDVANEEACQIEHVISEDSFHKMVEHWSEKHAGEKQESDK